MLRFRGAWRFNTPGAIPPEVSADFADLIGKIATQGDRQTILEHFKAYFASAAGTTASWSSSVSWAETDLRTYMTQAEENAPLFVEAFYDACDALGRKDLAVPDVAMMNRILSKHHTGYEIRPPDLNTGDSGDLAPIAVPERPASLDERALELIQKSLSHSEKFLSEGHYRQAVQEVLWLLETISTAFQGLETEGGTVEGAYFNRIIGDLRRRNQGKTLDLVLEWVTKLHGYLSAPKGGGIRHGTDLRAGVATTQREARLFCNLIRSYISYLLAEHEQMSKS